MKGFILIGKLKIDVRKLKNRFDFSDWRIALFIFSKFFELSDIYITSTYFSQNIINSDIFIFLVLVLSFIELYNLNIFIFTTFYSYTYSFAFYYSYKYIKSCFFITTIVSPFLIASLFTFFLIKSGKGFYSNKSFFEDDFGNYCENSRRPVHLLFLSIILFFVILWSIPFLLTDIKNTNDIIKNILKIGSGVIGALVPALLENLIHSYRSISIMDNNGVVVKNSLNPNASIFYFWFTNDKNSSIQVKFLGWCYGSNIKKANHNQWEISAINYYNPMYDSIVQNTNSTLKYTPFEFEDVKIFGMSTILSFKLDKEFKRHLFKTTDNICLIYIDSAGNFYAKKLHFDFIQ